MRHLSNLNIFHWAVMALSPGPHVYLCVCARLHLHLCASVEVYLNVNHICMSLLVTMRVLVKAREFCETNQPP